MANYCGLLLFVVARVLRRRAEHSPDLRPGDKFSYSTLHGAFGFFRLWFCRCCFAVAQWLHFLWKVEQKLVGDCVFSVWWKKFGTPVCWLWLFQQKLGSRESLPIPF